MHEGGTANLPSVPYLRKLSCRKKLTPKHLVSQCADARSSAEFVLRSHAYTCLAAHSRKGAGSEQLKRAWGLFIFSRGTVARKRMAYSRRRRSYLALLACCRDLAARCFTEILPPLSCHRGWFAEALGADGDVLWTTDEEEPLHPCWQYDHFFSGQSCI